MKKKKKTKKRSSNRKSLKTPSSGAALELALDGNINADIDIDGEVDINSDLSIDSDIDVNITEKRLGEKRNFQPSTIKKPKYNNVYPNQVNFVLEKPKSVCNDTLSSLATIRFDSKSALISSVSKKELDRLSKYLINKDYKITLMGHTDTDSTKTYNKALSLKRANSVKQYLVQTGCDPMQIGTVGYGEEDPLNNEQTTTEKYLNRRVEYCVVMNRN